MVFCVLSVSTLFSYAWGHSGVGLVLAQEVTDLLLPIFFFSLNTVILLSPNESKWAIIPLLEIASKCTADTSAY